MATLLMLLIPTGLNLLVPRIIQDVVDQGLVQGQTRQLVRSALLLFALGLGSAILSLGNRYGSEWIAARVGYDLRNRMYDHIQYLPFTYHDHAQSGQLISRCIEDVRAIEKFKVHDDPQLILARDQVHIVADFRFTVLFDGAHNNAVAPASQDEGVPPAPAQTADPTPRARGASARPRRAR